MDVSIVRRRGQLMIDIDGKAMPALAFKSFRPNPRNVSEFHEAGVRLYTVLSSGIISGLGIPYSLYGESWVGDGQYDFGPVDRQMDMYPALDPSRVYVTGYSMGGSSTNRTCYGDSSLFAAAVNMSGTPYTYEDDPYANADQFADIDIPMMLTTCTYDTATHFDSANGYIAPDFQLNIINYLKWNEMDKGLNAYEDFDFETYEFSGFKGDIYRETMINDEYPFYQWFFTNDAGAPMVGLSIIEFIPHGLYQEYAHIAWNYFKQFSRDPETKEIIYNPYAD